MEKNRYIILLDSPVFDVLIIGGVSFIDSRLICLSLGAMMQ